ncbi:MAG: PqqD family protein [Ruminococcaceae bacterium]|nr:PqqD family protein [Oscillospiraceae bacterium]
MLSNHEQSIKGEKQMKIKSDFTIQKVGSSYVAIAVGETSKTFRTMIKLNSTGAFLWNLLSEKDLTEEELVEALLAEYDVERETAANDVRKIVTVLAQNQILQ